MSALNLCIIHQRSEWFNFQIKLCSVKVPNNRHCALAVKLYVCCIYVALSLAVCACRLSTLDSNMGDVNPSSRLVVFTLSACASFAIVRCRFIIFIAATFYDFVAKKHSVFLAPSTWRTKPEIQLYWPQ